MDMSKLKTNIKRFFSNPNTITFILVIGLIVVIYLVYSYMIKRAISPINVPYCTNEIKTKTEITNEYVGSIQISGNFVTASGSNLLQNQRSIRNKYVAPGYFIPKNSFFYADAVAESDVAEKTLLHDLDENQTLYRLDTDFHATYGCSIMPGNVIDLYIQLVDADNPGNKVVFMPFITSIQVLAVYDKKGYDVFTESTENEPKPDKLIFNVTEEANAILMKAEHLNARYKIQVIPVPRNAGYSEDPKPMEINDVVRAFIDDKSDAR